MSLRVVLVDDDERFRSMARRALVAEGADVVAEVAGGAGAVDAVRTWQPDVVLVDIRMPGIDGPEVARRLRAEVPGAVVILISTVDPVDGSRLAEGVAAGYLPKDELGLPAILTVLERSS